jgi:uncharacterized protein (DUF1015 family)
MVTIYSFKALRPDPEKAESVAAPPYDVVSKVEAREIAEGNPNCFLRVGRAELDLADTIEPYSDEVYLHGAKQLQYFIDQGVMRRENQPILGVYRQKMGTHIQTGLVALSSVQEYDEGVIKKHEFTRPEKEEDRIRLILSHDSQSGPVFLTYRASVRLDMWTNQVTSQNPEVDFIAEDGVEHTVWIVRDSNIIEEALSGFREIPALYIADGHHRSAAASRVSQLLSSSGDENKEQAPHCGFLSVIFPDNQLQIFPYNRVVKDLYGHTAKQFLSRIEEKFSVQAIDDPGHPPLAGFECYLNGKWHRMFPREGVVPDIDPVGSLAVSVLSDNILDPILGITDQRRDKRIDFIGGIRGSSALSERVDSGEWAVAFYLYPTTVSELLAVADAGLVMPPKSTWFEPKLRDGLFVHLLEQNDRIGE